MSSFVGKILMIGIGNSGRQDDGLGWAFLDKVENRISGNFDLEYRYQLQIEDAELISHYKKVIFVDADMTHHKTGFVFSPLTPTTIQGYSSHSLSPESVLALAQNVYNKSPESWILGISGKSFELEIGLTDVGIENLEKAADFFLKELPKIIHFNSNST